MATSINYGDQEIIFDYKNSRISRFFNRILFDIMPVGVYAGEKTVGFSNETVTINPVTMIIKDKDELNVVRLQTTAPFDIDVNDTRDKFIIARFDWENVETNTVVFDVLPNSSLNQTDVVLGTINWNTETVEYDQAMIFDKTAKTRFLGLGVVQNVIEGRNWSLGGDDTIEQFVRSTVDRIYGLDGVNSNSVKKRHWDFSDIKADKLNVGQDLKENRNTTYTAESKAITEAMQRILDVQSTLESLENNTVGTRLIDIGSDSGKLNTSSVPVGANVAETLDNGYSISIDEADAIQTALITIADAIGNVAGTIDNNGTAIDDLKSRHAALKSRVENIEEIPVGTIGMYDGLGWQDNITIPGWYACTKANYDLGLTPNLEKKFLKATSPEDIGNEQTAGENSFTVYPQNLPSHQHTFEASFPKQKTKPKYEALFPGWKKVYNRSKHRHRYEDTFFSHERPIIITSIVAVTTVPGWSYGGGYVEYVTYDINLEDIYDERYNTTPGGTGSKSPADTDNVSMYRPNEKTTKSGNHSHSYTCQFEGKAENQKSDDPTPKAYDLSHYKVIFIKKLNQP